MVKKVVVPGVDPESRPFNRSCKPYLNLDSRFTVRCPGMTKCGFTLIELLVVVLIIGILSAVALPQYTKAVNKSRAVQAVPVIKSLIQATEVYYMANGSFPENLADLDVSISADMVFADAPDSSKPLKYMFRITRQGSVQAKAASADLPHYEAHPVATASVSNSANSGKFWCWVSADKSEKAEQICKSMGSFDSESSAINGGGRYYILK
ncbi:MAG: type II secretion system protein [Elusimicrobia bacterium]|nr:type II secretion system protein [Elusimicrobiota bacterium]MDY6039436.1 type II secretion system protein [Elusimicrobiaceae bacterium]